MTADGISDDEAFLAAWDAREAARVDSSLQAKAGSLDISAAERRRVRAIIERDRADRDRERARQEAIIRVQSGDIASSADATIDPTPEWLMQGQSQSYTPRQDEGSVRVIRTVRRVQTPYTARLLRLGKITPEQYAICRWYRFAHECAGLSGRYSTSRFGNTSVDQAKSRWGTAHLPINETEAIYREQFRLVRDAIPPALCSRFEKVVLLDAPLPTVSTALRVKNRRKYPWFFKVLGIIHATLERNDIEIPAAI